ncbi:MAG: DUF6115 domain-containing protein [Lachnospiraceae bacterium]|nr:DUF6115 domain-containing protein [Lachnospiraceae bacterium]
MTAIEVGLLLIGVVFLIGSFFVTEKLSQSEIGEIAKLSETELQTVIERELEIASAKVSDMVDDSVDLSLNKIQRSLDKETNDKMMAIQEYSDTVLKDLEKTNKEVTFLYSMLGDKHNELQDSIAKMNELTQECDELREQILNLEVEAKHLAEEPVRKPEQEPAKTDAVYEPDESDTEELLQEDLTDSEQQERRKEEILMRYRGGEDLVDIAKDLDMGFGEVKLIVELYNGEGLA